VMGALVSAIQSGTSLVAPLATAGVAFVAMQALGPLHDAVSGNLGAKASAWLHDRLLDACIGPGGLAHLEDPELADRLSAARDFDAGTTGPTVPGARPVTG